MTSTLVTFYLLPCLVVPVAIRAFWILLGMSFEFLHSRIEGILSAAWIQTVGPATCAFSDPGVCKVCSIISDWRCRGSSQGSCRNFGFPMGIHFSTWEIRHMIMDVLHSNEL
jgi:hypothetical protein